MLHLNALFAVLHSVEIVGNHRRKVENTQVQQADDRDVIEEPNSEAKADRTQGRQADSGQDSQILPFAFGYKAAFGEVLEALVP